MEKIMPEPIAALLTIPYAFIGPVAWDIASLSLNQIVQIVKRIQPTQNN